MDEPLTNRPNATVARATEANPKTRQAGGWDIETFRKLVNAAEGAEAPKLPEGLEIVDAHVHLFPERLFEAIWKWFDDYAWKIIFKRPLPELTEYLKNMGVKKAFCLMYAHREGVASGLNRWIAELAEREPMIVPFGAFHQDDDPDAVLTQALDGLGLAGIKIHCNVQRATADDPRFFPLYERLQAANKTLVIHGGTQPVPDEFVGLSHLRRALEKFPSLRVQIAHMGAEEYPRVFALLNDFPNVTLDTSIIFNDSFSFLPREYDEAVVSYSDRILWGSDFPNIWFTPEAGVATLLSRGYPEDAVRKILYENAARLFGL